MFVRLREETLKYLEEQFGGLPEGLEAAELTVRWKGQNSASQGVKESFPLPEPEEIGWGWEGWYVGETRKRLTYHWYIVRAKRPGGQTILRITAAGREMWVSDDLPR